MPGRRAAQPSPHLAKQRAHQAPAISVLPPFLLAMASFPSTLPALRASINALGRRAVEFANPALDYESRYTRDFPLMQLDVVLLILAGYLVLVLAGIVMRDCCSPRASAKATAAAPADKVVKPTDEKFRAEPILYLALPYNWLQVTLCGYMMVAAGAAAMQRGYTPLCNAFQAQPKNSALADVLWVFYVSKVSGGRGRPPPPPTPHTPTAAATRPFPPPRPCRSSTLWTR